MDERTTLWRVNLEIPYNAIAAHKADACSSLLALRIGTDERRAAARTRKKRHHDRAQGDEQACPTKFGYIKKT